MRLEPVVSLKCGYDGQPIEAAWLLPPPQTVRRGTGIAYQTDSSVREPIYCVLFRLDALALSVIATATWLPGWVAGWLAGWVSVTAGIVSKRLNLSENFLDHLVGTSFKHL